MPPLLCKECGATDLKSHTPGCKEGHRRLMAAVRLHEMLHGRVALTPVSDDAKAGRLVYEAYVRAIVDAYKPGTPLESVSTSSISCPWDDLTATVQSAWIKAADAAVQAERERMMVLVRMQIEGASGPLSVVAREPLRALLAALSPTPGDSDDK